MDKKVKEFFELLNIDVTKKHYYHYYTIPKTSVKLFVQSGKTIKDIFEKYEGNTKLRWRMKNNWFYVNEGICEYKYTTRELKNKKGKKYNQQFRKEIENRKTEKRTAYNAFYFDFDLHGNDGKHFQGEQLTELKTILYKMIVERVPLNPSAIVETGNGYHVYYAIAEENRHMKEIEWKNTETQMLNYMYCNVSTDIDFAVSDSSRVLRIPDTYHCKDDSSTVTKINIVHLNKKRYTLNELKREFFVTDVMLKSKMLKRKNVNHTVTQNQTSVITAIANLDRAFFSKYINKINISNMTVEQKADYIKSYDMIYFLQLNVNQREVFSSILRTDSNPSAAIDNVCSYINNKSVYLYHDFSLDNTYDLIHVVCEIAKCTAKESFQFLCDIFFKHNIIHTDIDAFIRNNIDCIATLSEIKDYKFLKKVLITYKQLMLMLKERTELTNVPYMQYDLFVASDYIAQQTNSNRTTVRTHLLLLEHLCMVNRVDAFSIQKGKSSIKTFRFIDISKRIDAIIFQLDFLKKNYSNVMKCSQDDLDKIIMW